MLKKSKINFFGKKVLVMGLGIQSGGVEAVKFLWNRGAKITVTDLRSRKDLKESIKQLQKYHGIRYSLGKHQSSDLGWADCILKNPGVPPYSPYLRHAKRLKIPIFTDIGIFFRLCSAPIIGITGTRGKSTAAYLIYKFLTSIPRFQKNTFLAGNIGTSVLAILPKLNKKSMVVLELSSFQLEDLKLERVSPHIAAVTNIYRDHLNWHKNFKKYVEAKRVILQYQTPSDFAFINAQNPVVRKMARGVSSHVNSAKLPKLFRTQIDKNLGAHFCQTVALAVAVGTHIGVPARRMLKILENFHGLPGRQEKIRTIHKVHFINDTTATIPDATIAAIDRFFALKSPRAKLILIAGGTDKKLDFTALVKKVRRKVNTLILLPGNATEKIKALLFEHSRRHTDKKNQKVTPRHARGVLMRDAQTMQDAVKTAYLSSKSGDWVILSPGAASFGLFLNEFDRGRQFINAVQEL